MREHQNLRNLKLFCQLCPTSPKKGLMILLIINPLVPEVGNQVVRDTCVPDSIKRQLTIYLFM